MEAVEAATRSALDADAASDNVILNMLARPRPASIVTPGDLALMHPPVANCARYDSLRGIRAVA